MSTQRQKTRGEDRLTPHTVCICRRPSPGSTRGAQKPRGILRHAIEPNLEMQVWTGRTARRAHRRHPLPAHDEVAFADIHLGRVGVTRNQSVAVVDRDDLTILGLLPATR